MKFGKYLQKIEVVKIGETNSDSHSKNLSPQEQREYKRKIIELERKARMQARKEQKENLKANRKDFEKQREQILQNQKDVARENILSENQRNEELNAQNAAIDKSIRDARRKNIRKGQKRAHKRAKHFRRFQSRVWWKGYLTIIGWVLLIFVVLLGIFYIFRVIGFDLLDLISGSPDSGLIFRNLLY